MRLLVRLLACSVLFVGAAPAEAQESDDEVTLDRDGSAETPRTDVPPADAPSADAAPDVSPERAAQSSAPSTTVINVHAREEERAPPQQSYFDPHEVDGEGYHHVGAFVRGIFAPRFIQNIFVNGGVNALNVGAGGFYNYRRDGLNIIAEVWWAGFYGTGPFVGKNEPQTNIEMLESELLVVFGNIVLMWSIPIASWLAIELGFGIGFGGVFGALWRTEAYPDGETWRACDGPDDPSTSYCEASVAQGGEGQYQRREGTPEPYNFSGGVPPLWFWIDLPRVAVRIKPLRQLQIRVEGGFAAYAFHFGSSLAFGF